MNPHFLFGCAEKTAPADACRSQPPVGRPLRRRQTAVHGQKKRRLGAKPAPMAPFLLQYGGRCSRCGADLPACTGCAWAFGNREMLPRIWGCRLAFGVVNARSVLLTPRVPLRYALPRPIPGGESKGEGPQPRPFVSFQGGPGGNRNPPGFLFGGRGGTLLFSKEKCPPSLSPLERGRFLYAMMTPITRNAMVSSRKYKISFHTYLTHLS